MNRTAANHGSPLPYHPVYREMCGSVTAAILFVQLEVAFNQSPDGFTRFLAPAPKHSRYKPGRSWTEILKFSVDEFRGAFDQIGIRYTSKSEFDAAAEKFTRPDGVLAYYASYHDKKRGETHYFRNHAVIDERLRELNDRDQYEVEKASPVNGKSPFTVNGKSPFPHIEGTRARARDSEFSFNNTNTHADNPSARDIGEPSSPCVGGNESIREGLLKKAHHAWRAAVLDAFHYWQEQCEHAKARLDEARVKAIYKALLLRAEYDPAHAHIATAKQIAEALRDVKEAIRGCRLDPWEDRKRFDDIKVICRDAASLERFMGIAEAHACTESATTQTQEFPYQDILANIEAFDRKRQVAMESGEPVDQPPRERNSSRRDSRPDRTSSSASPPDEVA